MRIDYILKASAKRMKDVSVECDSGFSTVCISAKGQDDIFMQGDDADAFILEIENLSKRCKALNPEIIKLALAEPYCENLWN